MADSLAISPAGPQNVPSSRKTSKNGNGSGHSPKNQKKAIAETSAVPPVTFLGSVLTLMEARARKRRLDKTTAAGTETDIYSRFVNKEGTWLYLRSGSNQASRQDREGRFVSFDLFRVPVALHGKGASRAIKKIIDDFGQGGDPSHVNP